MSLASTAGPRSTSPSSSTAARMGVLVVESDRPTAFDEEDFGILTAAANQASIAIGRARLLAQQRDLLEAERRRADEHQAILATSAALSSELELSKVLMAVLERAVRAAGRQPGASWPSSARTPTNWRSSPTTIPGGSRSGPGWPWAKGPWDGSPRPGNR